VTNLAPFVLKRISKNGIFPCMRIICLFLCLSFALYGEDWTVAGKDYHNVKVTSVADDSVAVTYDGGIGHFNLSDLTPELKKRFNYDPAKAKAAQAQKQEELTEVARQQQAAVSAGASLSTANVRVIQVTPDGFLGVIFTKWGVSNPGFVRGNTKGMIDGGLWTGSITQAGTMSYTDTEGAERTVQQFEIAPSSASTFSDEQAGPPRPVDSLQAVGGG
jgi:hypothetical protein